MRNNRIRVEDFWNVHDFFQPKSDYVLNLVSLDFEASFDSNKIKRNDVRWTVDQVCTVVAGSHHSFSSSLV